MLIRFAQCCHPVPGDDIIGFVTRGRGVSIHTANCPNVDEIVIDQERKIDVQWEFKSGKRYPVRVKIESLDRPGILAAISAGIAHGGVNITGYQVMTRDGTGHHELELEIEDLKQLQRVMRRIGQVKGVKKVERLRGRGEGSTRSAS
jgi:GTP pyrophosphokinase